jgi:hypothetical protein
MTTLNDFVASITSAGLMTSNKFDVEFLPLLREFL